MKMVFKSLSTSILAITMIATVVTYPATAEPSKDLPVNLHILLDNPRGEKGNCVQKKVDYEDTIKGELQSLGWKFGETKLEEITERHNLEPLYKAQNELFGLLSNQVAIHVELNIYRTSYSNITACVVSSKIYALYNKNNTIVRAQDLNIIEIYDENDWRKWDNGRYSKFRKYIRDSLLEK